MTRFKVTDAFRAFVTPKADVGERGNATRPTPIGYAQPTRGPRHCEERSDEAIQQLLL